MKSIISLLFGWMVVGFVYVDGVPTRVVDVETDSMNNIGEYVCLYSPSYTKQISKVSTVSRLAEYLKHLPEEHIHAHCSRKYLVAIEELRDFLDVDTRNVCSEKKISAAEDLHRKYMVHRSRDKPQLPFMLRLFFYQYMYMMSRICSSETHHELVHLKNLKKSKLDELDGLLAIGTSSLKYDDIYLFWNLVNKELVRDNPEVSKYINFDGFYRVSVGVKNADKLKMLQETCRTIVKPIYSRTLLSTIRLIDMGYNPRQSDFLDLLKSNKKARRVYELTKLCEALLPVRVVEIGTLEDTRLALLHDYEVEHLLTNTSEPLEEAEVEQCKKCSVVALDKLPTVFLKDAVEIVSHVDSNLFKRAIVVDDILMRLVKKTKPNLFISLINKKYEKRFLVDQEMEKKSLEIQSNKVIEKAVTNTDKLVYFLNIVWWLLSSHS